VLTERAKEDVRKIVEFSRSCGPGIAFHFCEELRKARNRLSLEASSQHFEQTPMLVQVAGYWLICGAAADGVVRVARVLHGLDNWESDLFGGMSFPAMADDDY
jgi:plasmid stabilization system protein ParE